MGEKNGSKMNCFLSINGIAIIFLFEVPVSDIMDTLLMLDMPMKAVLLQLSVKASKSDSIPVEIYKYGMALTVKVHQPFWIV